MVEILAISHTHLEDNLKMKIKNKDQSRDLLLKFKLALQQVQSRVQTRKHP